MDELERLRERNAELEKKVGNLEEQLYRCPLTGLYNEGFFRKYIHGAIDVAAQLGAESCLLYISVDHLHEINLRFGSDAADETLKKAANYLPTLIPKAAVLFRLSGALFACYLPEFTPEAGASEAERIRAGMEAATIFVDTITVSIGLVSLKEACAQIETAVPADLDQAILNLNKRRLAAARRMGFNAVCSGGEESGNLPGKEVIVADEDSFRRNLISALLRSRGYAVFETGSGPHALEAAQRREISLVIADLSLPGLDALSLRASLSESSELSRIPFIVIADIKENDTVTRAYTLGVSVFLQRPILVGELLGLAASFLSRGGGE